MRITDLLALSFVPRWANVRHSPSQSVADHTFRVACIYLELCDRLKRDATLRGLTWAICHDGLESYTGDIPGDFKRELAEKLEEAESKLPVLVYGRTGVNGEPTEQERRLVKLADKIETYTFIATNGVGPHANRIRELMLQELTSLAGDDWGVVRLLAIDIIEEAERF